MDDNYDENYLNEDASPNGEKMNGGTASEVLTRVELDVAYSNEKALNLEILLMQMADRAIDYEALTLQDDLSNESIVKAFEFNILSGILSSEVRELDSFMASLQMNIVDASQQLPQCAHSEDLSTYIEEKLHGAEESLKQSQVVVADIRTRSAKYERNLASGIGADVEAESGEYSSTNAKWKLQTVEQQRHLLQMLEKSLARELDLEKKLSDSRCNEEDLRLKLLYAEREAYCLEESMETLVERMFEAENAAELLLGISKAQTGKLQLVQFNLNGSVLRESQLRSKLEESMKRSSAEESALEKLKTSCAERDNLESDGLKAHLKDVEDKYNRANSEALSLREKVSALEEQLRESDTQLQLAKASAEASHKKQSMSQIELKEMGHVIESLNEDILRLESRAGRAEAEYAQLTKNNLELNEQVGFLRNNGTDKANFLERKLKESDTQLEHAKASVEAIEEQQSMLHNALSDMENLIEDLKGKVSKAERRAESAESKCTLLTETNLELNEELGFLRSRLECVEASFNQAEDAKIATAKDIGIRTKFITDLVTKLAMERERLQLQISELTKKNKILAKKCLKTKDNALARNITSHKESDNENGFCIPKSSEEALVESSTTNLQVEKSNAAMPIPETTMENTVSAEGSLGSVSNLETVRTIEATQLNSKYLLMAVLVLLVSVLAIYLFQLENWSTG